MPQVSWLCLVRMWAGYLMLSLFTYLCNGGDIYRYYEEKCRNNQKADDGLCHLFLAEIGYGQRRDVLEKYLLPFAQMNETSSELQKNEKMMPLNQSAHLIDFVIDLCEHFSISTAVFLRHHSSSVEGWNKQKLKMYKGLMKSHVRIAFQLVTSAKGMQNEKCFFPYDESNSAYFILDELPIETFSELLVSYNGLANRPPLFVRHDDKLLGANLSLQIDSNLYLWKQQLNESHFTISEAWRSSPNFPIVHQPWGLWRPEWSLIVNSVNIWERRKDLTGIGFACATAPNEPYVINKAIPNSTYVEIDGFYGDIWKALQAELNFTYWMIPSVDGAWGALGSDGNWNGMVGMILRDEVDFAVSDLFLNDERAKVTDFTESLGLVPNQMYIKTPSTGDTGWSTFVNPFALDMWVATTASILLSALFLAFISYVREKEDFDLPASLFVSITSLFQQGAPSEPESFSMRIVFFAMFSSGLVIFASYSASLTSFLAVVKSRMPFQDMRGLYFSSDFKVGSLSATIFDDFFQNGSSLYRKIWEERYEPLATVADGIERMYADDKYAFIWATDTMNLYTGHSCDFTVVDEVVYEGILVILLKKNSPYTGLFNFFLKRMKESGQMDRMWLKWQPFTEKGCANAVAEGLSLTNVLSAFAALATLAGFALLLLLIEVFIAKLKKRSPISTSK